MDKIALINHFFKNNLYCIIIYKKLTYQIYYDIPMLRFILNILINIFLVKIY